MLGLLDESDVKGHAKAVCCFSSASTRQSVGFGTAFSRREHSLYPSLHRAKELLVNDIEDYVMENTAKNAVYERVRRSGRGWGPPPLTEKKMRDMYFQNHALKEDEKYDLEVLFCKLDGDNSGYLDHHEIEQIALRFAGPDRSVGEVYTCLRILDKDSDGKVSIHELERTIVLANALHRQIKECSLSMPEFFQAFALYIINCTVRSSRDEIAMSNSEYFQKRIKSLSNRIKAILGHEMIEIEEASQWRKKELEDLGLPPLVDPELEEAEEKYDDIVCRHIHPQYCQVELSASTHSLDQQGSNRDVSAATDNLPSSRYWEMDGICRNRSAKSALQAKKKLLFQDGFNAFVDHSKIYPKITEEEKVACFNTGVRKQHSRILNPRTRRTGLLVVSGNYTKASTLSKLNEAAMELEDNTAQYPRPPDGIVGLNENGMKVAIKHLAFLKFVNDCHQKGFVPFIGVYAVDLAIVDATESDLEHIYHATYVSDGKTKSFYGTYFRAMVNRLNAMYVIYKPQRIYGTGSSLGASHYQTGTVWKGQRDLSVVHSDTANDAGANSSNSKNRGPWVDEKPMVHIKNRLAKSTRYSRNALQYYQNALDVLSGNKTLATSFETFLDEAGEDKQPGVFFEAGQRGRNFSSGDGDAG